MNSNALIGILWLAFLVYWIVAAARSKPSVRGIKRKGRGVRLLVLVAIIFFYSLSSSFPALVRLDHVSFLALPAVEWVGFALVVIGMAFAVWARVYLGTNWGMPMTLKEGAELVTTGPYAYVRNPIYTGMLLALLGSLPANGALWTVPLAIFCFYFIYSAKQEEKIMLGKFPETYPAYKKRTKLLVPFIL